MIFIIFFILSLFSLSISLSFSLLCLFLSFSLSLYLVLTSLPLCLHTHSLCLSLSSSSFCLSLFLSSSLFSAQTITDLGMEAGHTSSLSYSSPIVRRKSVSSGRVSVISATPNILDDQSSHESLMLLDNLDKIFQALNHNQVHNNII